MYCFKTKNSMLYCPNVRLYSNILEYVTCTKYLGFTFNMNSQDNDDMLRHIFDRTNYYALFITVPSTLN